MAAPQPSSLSSDGSVSAVVGTGAMGAGIVEVLAAAGHRVHAVDTGAEAIDRGKQILDTSTGRAVERGKRTEQDRDALLGRVTFGTDLAPVADAQLIIEAVSENPELKAQIFPSLDAVAAPEAILATNTSSLSVTALAAATDRPGRVIGLHFFNPAPVQPLVEVVSTVLTDPDVTARAARLVTGLGKTPVACTDRAGFVVNALLLPYLNRAATLYQDGFATAAEIDDTIVAAAGHPLGPLDLLDLVGLDVTVSALQRMYAESRDRRHAPAPLLTTLVSAGHLGRKSGAGIRIGADADRLVPTAPGDGTGTDGFAATVRRSRVSELPEALLLPYLNDACRMVEIGYATAETVDTGMSLGCRMPKPFDVIGRLGPEVVLAGQRQIFAETAEPGDRPSRLLQQLGEHTDPAGALADLRLPAHR